jgi:predicted 3-demethylubiquinone-9 3-methyltransferase (glyoxalase superfamily)
MQKITPCIWFVNQADEAARLYTSVFKNSGIGKSARYGDAGADISGMAKGSVMTVDFQIAGQSILGLNGGPHYEHTPSVSLFATCGTKEEVDAIYQKLSPGGKVLFELGKYPFCEYYTFFSDKFGVYWQLFYEKGAEQKVTPSIIFSGEKRGFGAKAIQFYLSLFQNSKVLIDHRYEKDQGGRPGDVAHARLSLDGSELIIMDSGHDKAMPITGALSLIVNCQDQNEVDTYWSAIAKEGKEIQCGWIEDKFGLSWQIVPVEMSQIFSSSDPQKTERAMKAMLQMKKLDIDKLRAAAEQK